MSGLAWGTVILGVAGAAGLGLALFGRTRLSRGFVSFVLALCGAGIGLGLGLVDGSGMPPQAIAAIVILALLTPLHVRVVLGPFGRNG